MDAHLFRLFTTALEPMLLGARLEKIQEPAARHLNLALYGNNKKYNLCFRFGRKDCFCFSSPVRPEALPKPSAHVMRLRKYFQERRIVSMVPQFLQRKLWLMASGSQAGETGTAWLCLDLVNGASLHFLKEEELPQPDNMLWPRRDEMRQAMENWREWPSLTPLLRKTLAKLPEPDGAALIADLEAGGGDVFLYLDDGGSVKNVAAWPLPPNRNLREIVCPETLPAIEKAGHDLVLEAIHLGKARQAQLAETRREKKLRKTLDRLEEDEKRLRAMIDREQNAKLIAVNLWRLPKGEKKAELELPDVNGCVRIELDRRLTIAENMERMFHAARRGKRGLIMLESRRDALRGEKTDAAGARPGVPAVAGAKSDKPSVAGRDKHVQFFISAEGFQILRGRDSQGNRIVRRMASGHDLWTHVKEGPGAHVIIRRAHGGIEPPLATLQLAGTLAANKSWLSEASQAEVMFAEARHVKTSRAGPEGKVLIDKLWRVMTVPVDRNLEKAASESQCGE